MTGVTLSMVRCHFCPAAPSGRYVTTTDAPPTLLARQGGETRTRLVVPLCARHHTLLQRAGQQGKLHAPTRVRWWLGVR